MAVGAWGEYDFGDLFKELSPFNGTADLGSVAAGNTVTNINTGSPNLGITAREDGARTCYLGDPGELVIVSNTQANGVVVGGANSDASSAEDLASGDYLGLFYRPGFVYDNL